MARQVFRTWEDYFIPGTSVLRNKFTTPGNPYGEPDAVKLRFLEEGYASSRILELAQTPIKGNFDYAHMKAIHHHIFQDIYEWAGQERVAPLGTFMVKSGPDVVHYPLGDPAAPQMSYQYYPAGPVLGQAANEQYRRLSKMDLLRGLDHETFVAARFYSQATGSNQRLAAALRPAIVPLTAPLEQA
jgi:cell filamentation protein fic